VILVRVRIFWVLKMPICGVEDLRKCTQKDEVSKWFRVACRNGMNAFRSVMGGWHGSGVG
jgi:hypothetical protein